MEQSDHFIGVPLSSNGLGDRDDDDDDDDDDDLVDDDMTNNCRLRELERSTFEQFKIYKQD